MIILYILLGIVALIAVVVLIASTRPSEFEYSRSTTISAPPEAVFAVVNNFHKWEDWSPWAKLDPNSKVAYDGPDSGVGAGFSWSGNNKVGEGRMKIAQSEPSSLIRINLDFLRPFKASNIAQFTFTSQGNQTLVNWKMSGHNPLPGKVFGLFVDCDKMVGKDFEKGLASMKALVEASK